jgi:hypothetical protein
MRKMAWRPESKLAWLLISATLALLLPCTAWGALGAAYNTIALDHQRLGGTVKLLQQNSQYAVAELQTPSHVTIREYIAPNGAVFGVAWSGYVMPDLAQILGQYFEPLRQAMAQRSRLVRGPVAIHTPTLVYENFGHMRAFIGRAYLPAQLPAGVTEAEIR